MMLPLNLFHGWYVDLYVGKGPALKVRNYRNFSP